ncbi:MAG: radical SAM protein, partial [Magnetococcales bacterium]|nr:radical SAM protein [Magnetococcales bacterium]
GEQARFVHGVLETLAQPPSEPDNASLAQAIDQALAQEDPQRLYAQAVTAHPNGEDALLLLGPWLRALGEPARLTEWVGKAVAMAARRTVPATSVTPEPTPGRIEVMAFEVVAACHNDCLDCAHGEMRKSSKRYQLSMEQVRRFIQVTEASGYTIGAVNLHGPGEPLLWKHFNEAIPLLKASPAIESIIVNTTGKEMDRVADAVWGCIDRVELSIYDPEGEADLVRRLSAKYHNRLNVLPMNLFWERVRKTEVADTPCWCACAGPMLFGDRIYFYCGPPVFDAAALAGTDIDALDYLYAPIEAHYLSRRDPSLVGNLALCRHCWANGNRYAQARRVRQVTTGGGWQ